MLINGLMYALKILNEYYKMSVEMDIDDFNLEDNQKFKETYREILNLFKKYYPDKDVGITIKLSDKESSTSNVNIHL